MCTHPVSWWSSILERIVIGLVLSLIVLLISKAHEIVEIVVAPSNISTDFTQKFQEITIHNGGQ